MSEHIRKYLAISVMYINVRSGLKRSHQSGLTVRGTVKEERDVSRAEGGGDGAGGRMWGEYIWGIWRGEC